MKTALKLLGIIAIVAVIGFGIISCGGNDDPDNDDPDGGNPVTGVELNRPAILLIQEQERRFYANISPDNASNKAVTWSSSDPSKVTVTPVPNSSDVTIKAIAEGTATITVTTADGGKTAQCVVTVKSAEDAKTEVEAEEEKDRWGTSQDPNSTAKITGVYASDAYSVTVSGTAEKEGYMAYPYYQYVAEETTESYYLYTFKAKTLNGTRMLRAAPSAFCDGFSFEIVTTEKEYKFASNEKLKPGIYEMEFWCANELGTFSISDVEIKAITAEQKKEADEEYLDSLPPKARWSSFNDDNSKAKLSYEVANDGVVTITVTGSPEQQGDGVYNAWMATACYQYLSEPGKAYAYTFEAWTNSGTRRIRPQYYTDNDDEVYLGVEFEINSTKTEYTVYGDELPKGGIWTLDFQSAHQIGTYYVKIISIEPYTPRTVTITGLPSSLHWMEFTLIGEGEYIDDIEEDGEFPAGPLISFAFTGGSSGRTITNGSVMFTVFSFEEWDWNDYSPKFGKPWDETETGKFHIILSIWGGSGEGNYLYTNGAEFDANKLDGDDYKYDFSIEDSVTIDFSKFKLPNYYLTR